MADAMTGLMDQLNSGFKKKGLDTTREGNNITVQGVKKSEDKPVSREEQKKYSESLKRMREREMKQRGITGKQFADEANKGIGPNDGMDSMMDGMKKGGKVSSASSRADGCAIRGKTRA